MDSKRIFSVESADALQAMASPIRMQVLDALREPASAAIVARSIGLPRQKVNYHVKELVRVGLVTHAGERRKGNFLEQLYQTVAKRLVVSPTITWNKEKLAATLRDQVSLAQLSRLGERFQQDAAELLDRAAYDDEEIPSLSLESKLGFDNVDERQQFMTEYMRAVKPLLEKWGAADGETFKLTMAIYPDTSRTETN